MSISIFRRLSHSGVALGPELTHTMKLGTQLFNPHRLKTVLYGLAHVSGRLSAKDAGVVSEYLQSATRCFENTVNIKLIGVPQAVEILRALGSDLASVTGAASLEQRILKSLTSYPLTEADLICLASSGLQYRELDRILATAAPNVSNIRTRVHLLRFIRYDQVHEYLKTIIYLSREHLAGSQLADRELCILAQLLDGTPRRNSMDALKLRVTTDVQNAQSLGAKSKALDKLLSLKTKALIEACGIHFRDMEKSPAQSVKWICLTEGIQQDHEVETLLWRVSRDARWLKGVPDANIVEFAKAMVGSAMRVCVYRVLADELGTRDFALLTELLNGLGDVNWIEHAELAEVLVKSTLRESKQSKSLIDASRTWCAFITAFGISDFGLIRDKVPEAIHGEIATFIPSRPLTPSHLNNMFVARILRRDDGGANQLLGRILESLGSKGVFPLHAQTSNFPTSVLIDALDHPRFSERLDNYERVSEILRDHPQGTLLDKMEFLKRLGKDGFPSEDLIAAIAKEINSETSFDVISEFVKICTDVRVPFDPENFTLLLRSRDLRFAPVDQVVELTRNLSSLGMLSSELGSRLWKSVLLNEGFESLSPEVKAKHVGSILAALFIALKRPTDTQLASARRYICLCPDAVDTFDRAVIEEFCHVNEISPIVPRITVAAENGASVTQTWTMEDLNSIISKLHVSPDEVRSNVRTGLTFLSEADFLVGGKRGVLIAGPGSLTNSRNADLTQFMKFRAYLLKEYVGDARVQLL